jgi:hypothetical protein
MQNRVVEIRKLVAVKDWRFCPGNHNPVSYPRDLSRSRSRFRFIAVNKREKFSIN